MNDFNFILEVILSAIAVVAVITQLAIQQSSLYREPPAVESIRRLKIAGWSILCIMSIFGAWQNTASSWSETFQVLPVLLPISIIGFADMLGGLLRLFGTPSSYQLKYGKKSNQNQETREDLSGLYPNSEPSSFYGRRKTDMYTSQPMDLMDRKHSEFH